MAGGFSIACCRHNSFTDVRAQDGCATDITRAKTLEHLGDDDLILLPKGWLIVGHSIGQDGDWCRRDHNRGVDAKEINVFWCGLHTLQTRSGPDLHRRSLQGCLNLLIDKAGRLPRA